MSDLFSKFDDLIALREGLLSSGVTDGAGRRVWSLIRRRRAMTAQFMTTDEPPWAKNGVVRPVSGMSRVTPPMTTNT